MRKMLIGLAVSLLALCGLTAATTTPAHAAAYSTVHVGPHGCNPNCPGAAVRVETTTVDEGNSIRIVRIDLNCASGCGQLSGNGFKWLHVRIYGSGGALLWTSPEFKVFAAGTQTLYPNFAGGKGAQWFLDGVIDYKSTVPYDATFGECFQVHPSGSNSHPGCNYTQNF